MKIIKKLTFGYLNSFQKEIMEKKLLDYGNYGDYGKNFTM